MRRDFWLCLYVVLGLMCGSLPVSAGTILITTEEAGLPAEKFVVAQRGISRAPQVELVEPTDHTQSPLHFQVRFRAFGGSKISTNSLQITYLKNPEIDLVPRVTRFVQSSGIDIPDAEIPPGDHFFRVAITDSEGRSRSSVLELKVAQ
jgi:hypothetical protein